MLLLQMPQLVQLIQKITLEKFYLQLFDYLKADFGRWEDFDKSPRHGVYVPQGVIELMPIADANHYTFKYVNGHPQNPLQKKLNVVAFGAFIDVKTGYPLMISEMTILTGIRTAAMSALVSSYMAKKSSKILSIIGCGAQSEFQVLAHAVLFNLKEIHFFDIDPLAMLRFEKNLLENGIKARLIAGKNAQSIVEVADIIITATAAPGKQKVVDFSWLKPGQHISGIGGDSPGKTELDIEILKNAKVIVEYFEQTKHEGEIQNLGEKAKDFVHAEFWEIVQGSKKARENDQEITLFESVGFALEDFSTLRLVYDLLQKEELSQNINLFPEQLSDCKNLFGILLQK